MNIYKKTFETHGLSLTQKKIIEIIGQDKKVLEIGSSSGYMTKAFLENNCQVVVVEVDKNAFKDIPQKVNLKIEGSIEDENVIKKLANKKYDFIVLADVLEHLVLPEKALKDLKKIADDKTRLIVSMGNIASWPIRKQLFFKGDFEYQESGILDKTHLHFYSFETLPKLMKKTGWKVNQIIGTITRIPLEETLSKLPLINLIFDYGKKYLIKNYPNLTFLHFVVISSK